MAKIKLIYIFLQNKKIIKYFNKKTYFVCTFEKCLTFFRFENNIIEYFHLALKRITKNSGININCIQNICNRSIS